MNKFIFLLLTALLCSNALASSTKISQNLASGAIGCPPKSILITDYASNRGVHTFGAICEGQKYYCTYMYPNPVSCKTASDQTPETELTKAEKAKQMDLWQTNLLNKAIQHWKKPESLSGMTNSQIQVQVDDKGKLLNLRWINSTGIRAIDRSIVNAFKDAAPFAPPPDISSAFKGVVITFPSIQQ
jgi:TonB family protein